MVRLGISTAAFYGRYEVEEAAAYISKLPVDCAEVFLQSFSEYSADFGRLVHGELKNIPCTSVHPLGTNFENQLASVSKRQRQDAFDLFRRVLEAGRELGAGVYVHHGRYSPQIRALAWDLKRNAEIISVMAEEAARYNMVIGWENVYWCQLTEPSRVLEAKEALPKVRFTLDIKQAMRAGCDPIAFVEAMGDRLCNVHVCDWQEDGTLCLPGEGSFDFGALFAALRKAEYDGPVIMEPYLKLIKSDEALSRSIAFLKNKIEMKE